MRGTQFAQLTAFVAVAQYSSFTKAAMHLGISPPSLSQAIRSLEEQFGVRLLNRTTRSVALTEAGEDLLGHLSPVMEGFERAVDAINAFRDRPAGILRLTVHPFAAATVIAPLVARFSAGYPEIRLDISVDDAYADIVSERFDAGIHPGNAVAQDMIAIPLAGDCRLGTVAAPDYLARSEAVRAPDDLSQHNCIKFCWAGDETEHVWTFKRADQSAAVDVSGSLSVNDLDFALRAGLDGVGIVQLPESLIAPFVADGRLVRVLPDWSSHRTDFVLFYPSRRHLPIKLRALVDFLRKESKRNTSAENSGVPLRIATSRPVAARAPSRIPHTAMLPAAAAC